MASWRFLVATERHWIKRKDAANRLLQIVRFLKKARRYHGVFPHFLHGTTGETIPFASKDDGGDIVETSYLFAGLLSARQYFNGDNGEESELRARINALWDDVEWSWHTRGGSEILYWHWSPNYAWSIGLEIRGWNECLITYVLAASSPRYGIAADVYHRGWAEGWSFKNGREFYGIRLPLGPDYGGPLCFAHYSFLGLDPRGLKDRYADYWEQNVNHTAHQSPTLHSQCQPLQRVWGRVLGAHGERRSSRVSRSCPQQRLGRDLANGGASVLSIYARAFDARVAAFLLRHGEQDLA